MCAASDSIRINSSYAPPSERTISHAQQHLVNNIKLQKYSCILHGPTPNEYAVTLRVGGATETRSGKLHHHDYSFIFKYVLIISSVNIFHSLFIEWNSVYFLQTGSATTQQAKLLIDVLPR